MQDGAEIVLIVPDAKPIQERGDRSGGQTHRGVVEFLWGTKAKPVSQEALKRSLEQCMAQIGDMLAEAKSQLKDGWEVGGVSVSLGVSGEGSIGIVTAGVQASIEVSFVPKKKGD